jgi:NAD(P)-dependent dehydrogenase (short-subunit alcohol dehydrogenase family)
MNFEQAIEAAKKNVNIRIRAQGRLIGKISVVTGAAQGFGLGIAKEMHKEGACIVIADLPSQRVAAEKVVKELSERAVFVPVDVTQEESVKALVCSTVEHFGGLDVFVSNAGILRAGSLDEMDLKTFELVTKVNYTGYFLCAKYACEIMKAEFQADNSRYSDIIQINSKSGLVGSKKNFAYSGSKFGGIGLTQSFALELAPYNIKVNAICPGNYYEGPLWSDPENGLFVQYLKEGKVPQAKTVEDVREFYHAKSPIHRGCCPQDVAKAVFYCIEQHYETGQALPVTGGQVMLT